MSVAWRALRLSTMMWSRTHTYNARAGMRPNRSWVVGGWERQVTIAIVLVMIVVSVELVLAKAEVAG